MSTTSMNSTTRSHASSHDNGKRGSNSRSGKRNKMKCKNLQVTQWFAGCALIFTAALTLMPDLIVALKDVSVTIPQAVKRGNNALLKCNYDLENLTLYSVKWYRGRREFYRYTPKENPPMKVFPGVVGIDVELNLSNQTQLVLQTVPLNASGKFTCEVSTEAPSFLTAMKSSEMEVVELPEEPTIVTGIQPRYRIGDLVDGNCSIKYSKPAANLTWTINGIVVPPHHIKTHQVEKFEDTNLESALSAIHFMVTTQHFIKGQMRLKCTASLFDIFKEEIETLIEEDRPRIMASGRSYEMDNNHYPYENPDNGNGFEDHNESYLTYYSAADTTSSAAALRPFSWPLQLSCTARYLEAISKQFTTFADWLHKRIVDLPRSYWLLAFEVQFKVFASSSVMGGVILKTILAILTIMITRKIAHKGSQMLLGNCQNTKDAKVMGVSSKKMPLPWTSLGEQRRIASGVANEQAVSEFSNNCIGKKPARASRLTAKLPINGGRQQLPQLSVACHREQGNGVSALQQQLSIALGTSIGNRPDGSQRSGSWRIVDGVASTAPPPSPSLPQCQQLETQKCNFAMMTLEMSVQVSKHQRSCNDTFSATRSSNNNTQMLSSLLLSMMITPLMVMMMNGDRAVNVVQSPC